jgi:hypothetical protein
MSFAYQTIVVRTVGSRVTVRCADERPAFRPESVRKAGQCTGLRCSGRRS